MSETVGLRALRTDTRAVMNRVQNGERLIVTDHNKPIAELVPIGDAPTTFEGMVDAGWITPAQQPLVINPLKIDGVSLSEALDETRAERDI